MWVLYVRGGKHEKITEFMNEVGQKLQTQRERVVNLLIDFSWAKFVANKMII